MKDIRILAIDPGSTSTKFAVYVDETCRFSRTIRHSLEDLSFYQDTCHQFDFRKGLIIDALVEEGIDVDHIKFIIGRGGLTYPMESGVYEVNHLMLEHAREGVYGQHASNLGPLMADFIANQIPGARAFIADPVVTDELCEIARITGHPAFTKRSVFHALNQKAIAREYARQTGVAYENLRLIVVHLGGGVSVGVHAGGKVIDVNNAFDGDGPFSPERSGSLPVGQVIDLCFEGRLSKEEVRRMVVGEGGYVAYLGTNDAREVQKRARGGDRKASLVQEALGYQVAKSIGEMAVVLEGQVDAILLTGGMAHNQDLICYLKKKTAFIANSYVFPGEDELRALAKNMLMVAKGRQTAKIYAPK